MYVFLKSGYIKLKKKKIIMLNCRVTICSPNPGELGYKSNEPIQ